MTFRGLLVQFVQSLTLDKLALVVVATSQYHELEQKEKNRSSERSTAKYQVEELYRREGLRAQERRRPWH